MNRQVLTDTMTGEIAERTVKRRGILAAAGAVAAGLLAKQASQPVAAITTDTRFFATGETGVGFNTGTGRVNFFDTGVYAQGSTLGVHGSGDGSRGIGVQGDGSGASAGVYGVGGNSSGYGVLGLGGGPNGLGVRGSGQGTGAGVEGAGGDNNGNGVQGFGVANGTGVFGQTSGGSQTKGVHGKHLSNGYGVFGETGNGGYGVTGVSPDAIGVNGTSTSGTGVYGQTGTGSSTKGVHGKHLGNGYGVFGEAGAGGYGVTGVATNAIGTLGQSNTGTGVYGLSAGGNGVYGVANAAGTTSVVAGVYGTSSVTYGIIGNTTAPGFSGLTAITSTAGVAALAATATVNTAYAAYFSGATVVQGDFAVVGGNKSAAVPHADGSHRLVYCVESPESWFEDVGKAKLVNGRADVKLDADFAQIIHPDDYHIFLTSYDASNKGLAVSAHSAGGFTVQETNGGVTSGVFSWRVMAKRKDIKGERLAKFNLPKINHPDPDKLAKPELPRKP